MASDNHPVTLMNIPLELRHHIFQYVAVRDTQPRKLLRYWFEKNEIKGKTAELAATNPNGAAPVVVFEGDQYEHEEEDGGDDEESEEDSDAEDDEDDDDDEGDENEDDSDEEDDEEDDEELDGEEFDEHGNEAEDQDVGIDSTVAHMTSAPAALSNAHLPADSGLTSSQQTTTSTPQVPTTLSQNTDTTVAAQGSTFAVSHPLADAEDDLSVSMPVANSVAMPAATTAPALTSDVVLAHSQDNAEGADADTHMDGHDDSQHQAVDGAAEGEDTRGDGDEINQENGDENGNETGGGESDEEVNEDRDTDTAAGVPQPPLPAPVITAHSKWRHIPRFLRITHCPPPVELLLACKQLNNEAKSWFYDVAVLHIEATGSFAHTSFFEEAFGQITEAAFSPMEDIRRAEVMFVWDTTWLHSEQAGFAGAIFPALLRQRAAFVVGILAQAPNLYDVVIHWYDSRQDNESVDLMNDVLMGFLGLNATVKVEPHYLAADVMPHRKSIAGRGRVAFQNIVDNGLDHLF